MRIVFAGTPKFSANILTALIDAGQNIVGVYCQPDRPKGRGQILSICSVKEKALAHNLTVFQPESLTNKKVQDTLEKLNADLMVVVAYGQLLPKPVLQIPKYGCLNIHASLLPRWRGAAPIQRAILAGDKTTGVSIMQMDKGLDTGAVLLKKKCAITDTDTAQTLHDKLSILGAKAILETLENLHNLAAKAQSSENVTYAKKLTKQEAWIDWTQSAEQINQQIRAFNPYPIAQTKATSNKFDAQILRIFCANIVKKSHYEKPGNIVLSTKGTCHIATGSGLLSLEQVQLSGKKKCSIKDFNNAYTLTKVE